MEQELPGRSSANPTNMGNPVHLPQTPDEPLLEVSVGNDTQQALSLTSPSLFQVPNIHGLVDWSAVKIRTDSAAADASLVLDPNLENQPDSISETYLEVYYAHFHHRWPIVHRPSLAEEPSIGIVFSSMTMIGAWLEGSVEAKKWALASHETLITDITSQLVRTSLNNMKIRRDE
jgi:hypothetical protein